MKHHLPRSRCQASSTSDLEAGRHDHLTLHSTSQLEDAFFQEIVAIVNGTGFSDNCTKCIAATEVVHLAAITQSVDTVTDLLIRACQANAFPAYAAAAFASTCQSAYLGVGGLGAYYAQLFAKMSLATGDFQAFCFYNYKVCTRPPVIKINETQWFTPKPASKMSAPSPSGQFQISPSVERQC
jgi:sphingomyelin phosphodiesterase